MSAFDDLAYNCRRAPPEVAVVLGSGLGPLAERVTPEVVVPFAEVPGLPAAAVLGHRGVFTLGAWAGRHVLLIEGRLHFYEGHPWEAVTRPVVSAAGLGARVVVLTNAAGGLADGLGPGRLMAITSQMEWNCPNFWRRPAPPSPYAPGLLAALRRAAAACGEGLAEGVYAAVTGPCYETPAEVRALRAHGADAVGMSTTREALAAAAAGLHVAGVSLITNKAAGLGAAPPSHEEVLATARATAARLADLLERFLVELPPRN
jgi:purine-nucleoside phosphorylase